MISDEFVQNEANWLNCGLPVQLREAFVFVFMTLLDTHIITIDDEKHNKLISKKTFYSSHFIGIFWSTLITSIHANYNSFCFWFRVYSLLFDLPASVFCVLCLRAVLYMFCVRLQSIHNWKGLQLTTVHLIHKCVCVCVWICFFLLFFIASTLFIPASQRSQDDRHKRIVFG